MNFIARRSTVFCILILASSCHSSGETAVAKVDGTQITVSDLISEMKMERGKYDAAVLSSEGNFNEFRRQSLNRLIEETVLLNEAKRLKIGVTQQQRDKIEGSLAGVMTQEDRKASFNAHGLKPKEWEVAQQRRLTIENLGQKEIVGRIPVTDAEISEYFHKHIQEFRQPTQFRARQIIADTRELADEIMAKIKDGEDFAALAKQYSVSPDGKRGGDLGYFDASSYPKHFSEVCQQLRLGEISEVVATDYGYQIFELLDKRQSYQRPIDEVKDSIRRHLQEERSAEAFKGYFETLRKKASISINEEVLRGVRLED